MLELALCFCWLVKICGTEQQFLLLQHSPIHKACCRLTLGLCWEDRPVEDH